MAASKGRARRALALVPQPRPADFTDAESQRVLSAAAKAVARELGREAAREYWAQLRRTSTKAAS
jgi:hypothetical protein